MANEVLVKSGTPIVISDTTDYGGDLGTRTDQIDLTSVAAAAARQSDQVDLGATRPAAYAVTVAIEFITAPSSGDIVSIWWAASPNATAADANPGGCSGSDSAYTGTTGDSIANSILQLALIGNLVCTNDVQPVVQFQTFMFSPEHRYGSVVVYNEADQALEDDAVEMGIALTPIVDEVQ